MVVRRAAPCCRLALVAFWVAAALPGCAVFQQTSGKAPQTSALSWLTSWVSQPMDVAAGFDVETLRPAARPPVVAPGDLLEVTIWDLYEPGKPHTFPVRVGDRQTIDVPFLGELPVENRTTPQIETAVIDGLKAGEFLVQPRVLVRSLDPPSMKIQVAGAVARAGYVELPRHDASVYAALVSAGGLRKTAGTQVGILRKQADQPAVAAVGTRAPPAGEPVITPAAAARQKAGQHANSVEPLSVATEIKHDIAVTGTTAEGRSSGAVAEAGESRDVGRNARQTKWYDVTRGDDREALAVLVLHDGDEVLIKAASPPVRIGGVVERPGAYPLDAGQTLDVWQALALAGGVHDEHSPLNITLVRPAAEGRPAKRWFLNIDDISHHPPQTPTVEPGDVLHVAPTAGSKIKRAVGDLWSRS